MFEQLLACSWRDVSFPISSMKFSFEQDHADHKYWGSDGVNVEATGRDKLVIEATIPFYNGITPGKNERWSVLYPDAFRNFVKAFTNRRTGLLVHPEFGEIVAKPQSFSTTHDAQRRDGVEVTATWVETLDLELRVVQVDAPVTTAERAARDLDASREDITQLAPQHPQFEETFDTFLNKISGSIDRVTTTAQLAANRPAQMIARVKRVRDSAERARSALTWPVVDATHRMHAAMLDLPKAITRASRKVLRMRVPATMTLAGIQTLIPTASTDDLIRLNPGLLVRPEVPAGSIVRYYAP